MPLIASSVANEYIQAQGKSWQKQWRNYSAGVNERYRDFRTRAQSASLTPVPTPYWVPELKILRDGCCRIGCPQPFAIRSKTTPEETSGIVTGH